MKNSRNIKLKTYNDIFNIIENLPENDIKFIDTNMLVDFRDHPFKVIENKDMEELLESIIENGILIPMLVRPLGDRYEIISGHRRKHCAVRAGIKQVPCIVKEMSYDDAVFAMVDSNIQRKNILPSEKAFSYKLKLNAVKHQGDRTDLTLRQVVDKSADLTSRQVGDKSADLTLRQVVDKSADLTSRQVGDKSADLIGRDYNDSGRNVQRYIRLVELTPFFLDAVDQKKISFGAGVNLSYLTKKEQDILEEVIKEHGSYPTINNAKRLRNHSGKLDKEHMEIIIVENHGKKEEILAEHKGDIATKVSGSDEKGYIRFNLDEIGKYFPRHYTPGNIEKEIIKMLENLNP